jgi:hypothetical protein
MHPYEHNAGEPYEWSETDKAPKWEILKVAFEASLTTRDSGGSSSSYCVRDINKGQVAWLESEPWEKTPVHISAGATWTNLLAQLKAPAEKSTWQYDHEVSKQIRCLRQKPKHFHDRGQAQIAVNRVRGTIP